MARTEVFEQIFQVLLTNDALFKLLGPRTSENMRLYRSYPQLMSVLTSYEPKGGEGWLLFHEEESLPSSSTSNFESIIEIVEVLFTAVATRFSLVDDVLDVLDQTWQWSVPQQREVQYGERLLLFSRRLTAAEKYAPDIKLPQKTSKYRMEFVLAEQPA
jgi:hypothetical protein